MINQALGGNKCILKRIPEPVLQENVQHRLHERLPDGRQKVCDQG